PAIAPVFWNLAIVAGLALGVPRAHGIDAKLYVYAVSIVVATLIQLLLPVPWLRGRDGRLQVVLDWRDPAVRRTFKLMVPITLGLGLINLNALVDTLFAARLIDKNQAPSAINAAFRLYIFPQGMFSVAVATVLFPTLAALASRRDYDAFRHTVATGLRQIAFLLVPASVVCAVLAEPIVRLVFQRRRMGRIELGETSAVFVKVVLASAVLAAVGYGIWRGLDSALGRSFAAQVVSLGVALAAGLGVYLAACRALRVREIEALLS